MNKHHLGSQGSQREVHRADDDKIQSPLGAEEEQLLRLMSAGAPLRRVLDGICSALDCQIGNVVSLISLPEDDSAEGTTIVTNAARFGLHAFCSEGVIAGNRQLLGSLEMYSCESRSPTPRESQCIERARCLASIAIKRHNKAARQSNCGIRRNRLVRGRVLQMQASMNKPYDV
jgi:hypothetical protein